MKGFIKTSIVVAICVTVGILLWGILRWDWLPALKESPMKAMEVFVFTLVISMGNYAFFVLLNRRIGWNKKPGKMLVIGFLGTLIITMGLFLLCLYVDIVWVRGTKTSSEFWQSSELFFQLVQVFKIAFIVDLIMHGLYFYKSWKDQKIREQQRIAGNAAARFDALKNQLDPHFLFNSLNVLTSLIEENPERAKDFTISLSKIYRYVLEQKNKELVSLQEELKFARIYMNLLKMRFESTIIFEVLVEEKAEEIMIVPLSLQLALENAIKHNLFSERTPLHITISTAQRYLIVHNNLQPKLKLEKGTGIGIENIRKRYALLTRQKIWVEKSATAYEIGLPLLTPEMILSQEELIRRKLRKKKDKFSQKQIEKRIRKERSFYLNLIAFCIVIAFMTFINYWDDSGFWWVLFPAIGWGSGLLFQYIGTFKNGNVFGKKWKRKKMNQFLVKNNDLSSTDEERYQWAEKKIKQLSDFYLSLVPFVLVVGAMAGVNYWQNSWENPWFLWLAFFWGIGLIYMLMKVYDFIPFLGKRWEEKRKEKYSNEDEI